MADAAQFQRRPLREQVAEHLRGVIRADHAVGERLPAESKLALQLSVSLTVVREAMALLAQEGVVERRHGSGTYVIDTRHIALLSELDLSDPRVSPFFIMALQRMRRLLQEKGLSARLYMGHTRHGSRPPDNLTCIEFYEDIQRDAIRAVIAVATPPCSDWQEPLRARGVPVIGSGPYGYDYCVTVDHGELIRRAVAWLAKRERRRIAMIGGGVLYRQACEGALRECGCDMEPAWIRQADSFSFAEGEAWRAFQELWTASEERPDGLIVSEDSIYHEVAMAVLDAGIRVPQQLAVVTHANRGALLHYPFQTTRFEVDPEQYAQEVCDFLDPLLAGETPERPMVQVPFHLVEGVRPRRSVRAAAAGKTAAAKD